MAITAQEVNKLRQMTGAGMMDCKKALVESDGDFDKAIEILRKEIPLLRAAFSPSLDSCRRSTPASAGM